MTKNKNKKISRKKSISKINICLGLSNKILSCLLISLIVGFVLNINNLSIKSFILRDLRAEASRLSMENEEVELQVMRLESYEHIVARAQELNMVKVDNIDYINVAATAMARK